MFLAGLTSVADWIASNELFFPISAHDSYQTHIEYAKHQAANALKTLHWTGWKPAQTDAIFTDLLKMLMASRSFLDHCKMKLSILQKILVSNPDWSSLKPRWVKVKPKPRFTSRINGLRTETTRLLFCLANYGNQ